MMKRFDIFGEEVEEDWEKEWLEMPEYINENLLKKELQIIVNFKSLEDKKNFFKLINQKFTNKTKLIWFPEAKKEVLIDKRWISDESNISDLHNQ